MLYNAACGNEWRPFFVGTPTAVSLNWDCNCTAFPKKNIPESVHNYNTKTVFPKGGAHKSAYRSCRTCRSSKTIRNRSRDPTRSVHPRRGSTISNSYWSTHLALRSCMMQVIQG